MKPDENPYDFIGEKDLQLVDFSNLEVEVLEGKHIPEKPWFYDV